jgi:hypothetical protein
VRRCVLSDAFVDIDVLAGQNHLPQPVQLFVSGIDVADLVSSKKRLLHSQKPFLSDILV